MKSYPLFKVHVDVESALTNVRSVLESGFLNEGTEVTKFTDEMSKFLGTKNVVPMNSCTSAITVALRLAGVPLKSAWSGAVISTPMTCVATNVPIVTCGANIIWADVDDSGMITKKTIRDAIIKANENGYLINAVVAVAWAGTPPELDKISELCKKYKIKFILDAAHALGAAYKGKQIHEWADYTCYSLQAIKHVTTGDGGLLVCSDEKDVTTASKLKWFGLDRNAAKDAVGNWKGQQWDVDIDVAGYKFNMNNLSAAIGLSQIPHLQGLIDSHRQHAKIYDEMFTGEAVKPAPRPGGAESSHWVYTVLVRDQETRDIIVKLLNDQGIHAGLVHIPNDSYTVFKDYADSGLKGLQSFSKRQFSIPCGWWLTEDDVRHIGHTLLKIIKDYDDRI